MTHSDNESNRRSADESDDEQGGDAFAPTDVQGTGDATGSSEPQGDATTDEAANAAADVERQLADQRDRYLRLAAEYDNYRKRAVRERQEAATRGQGDLVRSLVDALDDLARFAHVDPAATDSKTIVEGVQMVERKLLKTLTGLGLEIINPVDQTFDPAAMEAVATEPALSPEDDHVVARVYQQGYRFNGQLLRPARVVVKQWNG
jgi:molecular chaperone GrpE